MTYEFRCSIAEWFSMEPQSLKIVVPDLLMLRNFVFLFFTNRRNMHSSNIDLLRWTKTKQYPIFYFYFFTQASFIIVWPLTIEIAIISFWTHRAPMFIDNFHCLIFTICWYEWFAFDSYKNLFSFEAAVCAEIYPFSRIVCVLLS